jgi:carboxypeptidase C (cathepsin A)
MAVKFSEFSIGTIGADLEIVGYDSATPTNVQVSYSDLKTDVLADAGTVTSIATSAPLTGGTITESGTIGITQASSTTDGYLSAADFNAFSSASAGSTSFSLFNYYNFV